jgi:hypothetical protein
MPVADLPLINFFSFMTDTLAGSRQSQSLPAPNILDYNLLYFVVLFGSAAGVLLLFYFQRQLNLFVVPLYILFVPLLAFAGGSALR